MDAAISGWVERRLTAVVHRRMTEEPVVVLTGPRAVGKSTLLRQVANAVGRDVIDLDDLGVREAVQGDPQFFASGSAPVLVDEFQKVPELLDAIKSELNRRLTSGRFLLTGSTRYETLPRASQSLTGRAHVMVVWPLSQGEIEGRRETFVEALLENPAHLVSTAVSRTRREDYALRITAGGYPMALAKRSKARERWFADYISLICERDVLELSRIRQRAQLPRLLRRLAGQTAQVLQIAEAARATDMEPSTAESYTQLLEAVFLLHRLPAWGATLGSKVGFKPKVHMVDAGLAAHLLRITPEKLARRTPAALSEFGHLLETFVVGEILKQLSWHEGVVTTGHWRTRDGAEVDLILERADGGVVGIEVKASSRVPGEDFRHLTHLADRVGEDWLGGVVLYTGTRSYTYDARRSLHVLPVDGLWSA